MANNRDILNSIDPVVLAARAALERNSRMLGDADRRIARMGRDDEARRVGRISPTRLHRPLPGEEVKYEAPGVLMDPDSWLNRGLSSLAGNAASVILGEGTGNTAADIALGFTGPGAAVGTVAAGNQPGALDFLPGGNVMKTGIIGLIKAGKGAEAKTFMNILQNPIANRFANRYPQEALESLDKFVKKYPSLKNMNTAEVYDVMQSGKLGGEYFVDLGKNYPEAMTLFGDTRRPVFTDRRGTRLSLRDILEGAKGTYPESYTRPLEALMDKVDALRERGDYMGAFLNAGIADANIMGLVDLPPDRLAKMSEEAFSKRLANAVPQSLEKDPAKHYIEATNLGSTGEANLVNEYMHLQADPVEWERLIEMDAKKAQAEAQKAAALERKAEQADRKQAAEYSSRLKEFKKNPKKALKMANSAAPKMVRSQGDAAVREWYFGVDPMATDAKTATAVEMKPAETVVADLAPAPEPAVQQVANQAPTSAAVVGGPNKWRENGWVSSEHPISEPGLDYSMLGKNATEDDRRALYVLDSLASEAASKLVRNNRFQNEWPGRSTLRHQGTNYDAKSREFGTDIAYNARTGNLPKTGNAVILRGAVSSAGNRLPGQMTAVLDGEDLYDLLFRKKVDRKINSLDNRYKVDFLNRQ
ncbi:MAG: hypothetical protein IIW08_09235 [Clostridia bacterium]|nr:hypothetical protein [Clostridia bacterium]